MAESRPSLTAPPLAGTHVRVRSSPDVEDPAGAGNTPGPWSDWLESNVPDATPSAEEPRAPRDNTWKHRLIEKDIESRTGVCAVCGPVEIIARSAQGKVGWRCRPAREAQRNSPNRRRKSENPRMRGPSRRNSHGLTREEARLFRLAQPTCAICGGPSEAVDHCHVNGKIRGALCRPCNMGLGFFADDVARIRAAAAYLERHASA